MVKKGFEKESKAAKAPKASRGFHFRGGNRNREKAVLIGLVLVGVLGMVGVFLYFRRAKSSKITNFQECVQAGNLDLGSLPRQCRTQRGEVFVEEVEGKEGKDLPAGRQEDEKEVCEDLCGDGICQEIVCLGAGCPCAETAEGCPEDCRE